MAVAPRAAGAVEGEYSNLDEAYRAAEDDLDPFLER
jgi:hypothetical protein